MSYPHTPRWIIVNLVRLRWAANADKYADAVRIADELELATGQLHGVERA